MAWPAPAGGLEQVVLGLAAGHQRRGHDVAVASINVEGHAPPSIERALEEAGVTLFRIRLPSRAYRMERRAVADVCRRFAPDVVHTHGYRADVVDRGVARKLGLPAVTTVHGPSILKGIRGAIYERVQRWNYRRFDAVVAVSRALRDLTLADGVAADRLHLIPNAWGGTLVPLPRDEARRELGLPADATVVGWVGRLIPVKGGDVFIDAICRLPQPRPIVVMIGHGIEAASLRERVRRLGLEDVVRFHADVRTAGRLFTAFDVYVQSSRSEGLPIVLLEAMAARTPIVATRVGGIPDLLPGEEALLVEPDDADALAAAIARALGDREASRARVQRATERLETGFATEPWLERYEAVYAGVVDRARITGPAPLTPRPAAPARG